MTAPTLPPADDDIRRWLRATPEAWDAPRSDEQLLDEVLVRRVASGEVRARIERARRRRRAVTGTLAIGLLAAGGAAGVAAISRSGQPTRPEIGVVCRAAATPDADALLLAGDGDPLAVCAEAWQDGRMAALGAEPPSAPAGEAPQLVGCVGAGGAIEVVPGSAGTCPALGLEPLAELDADALAIVELGARVADEINLTCVRGRDVAARLEQLLDDIGLTGWRIELDPQLEDDSCALVAVDAATHLLVARAAP